MKKYLLTVACIALLLLSVLCGCGTNGPAPGNSETPQAMSSTPGAPDSASQSPAAAANEAPDSSASAGNPPEASSEAPEGTQGAVAAETPDPGTYDKSFELLIEAEDGDLSGQVKVESSKKGFTGTGYLTGFENEGDTAVFTVTVPGSGLYDLNFRSVGNVGHKENNILVDGQMVGVAKVDGDQFTDSIVTKVYMAAGEHKIQVQKVWGWILLDSLTVKAAAPADQSIYKVSAGLADENATGRTKRLMQYLADNYGKYVISGQYCDRGIDGYEFKAIYNETGKYPAILGLDFIEYTPSRVTHGSTSKDVEYAIDFDNKGGIVTFCWHWNAPEKYLVDSSDNPWWKGFYKEGANIDLKKIMNGGDQEGYDLLVKDIDAIAVQLKRLQDVDVPILWRPLHEASGGWFWWGTGGQEAYIELYRLVYDRLVNYHGIHNLIWVWNGQNKDWYPGDEYVDIAGIDIYPGERVYSSQGSQFDELVKWNGDNKRIITLSENGCLPDPDLVFRDNAIWSYFCTWEGDFVVQNKTYTLSEKYTEKSMMKKVYTSDKVITLDELPDLKKYGNP